MPNPPNKIKWYPDEVVYILKNFVDMTAKELLEHINANRKRKIHIHSLRVKCYELGLFKNEANIPWNERETSFLINSYQTIGNIKICKVLNKYSDRTRQFTPKTIWKKMKLLGLKRKASSLDSIKRNHIKNGSWKKSQHIVADKRRYPEGKKVIRIIGNWKCYYIKYNGKMLAYHRYLWEQNFGPIPQGFKIYFKDGNPMNCKIDNLLCLKGHWRKKKATIEVPQVFFQKDNVASKKSPIYEVTLQKARYSSVLDTN